MKTKIAMVGALLAGFVLPAVAQMGTSDYIVQDTKTRKCTIIDQKPVATEATAVGPDGVVYHTRTEAETAIKTVKVCAAD